MNHKITLIVRSCHGRWSSLLVAGLFAITGLNVGAQSNPPLLKKFGNASQLEFIPSASLLRGSDGNLFGTAYSGGPSNFGCVFKITTNGGGYTVLHYFSGSDGANPEGGLLEASDGNLYGTTFSGGISNVGCVFRVDKFGDNYSVLKQFSGGVADGANPSAALSEATNGVLFGTTYTGGNFTNGTIFSINKNGTGYTVLTHFAGTNGANPSTSLLSASDGRLYGTTDAGGTSSNGTVFAVNLDGSDFTNLVHFTGTGGDGASPLADLIEGVDGALYGTTYLGGTSNAGTIYKLNQDGGGYAVLLQFAGATSGDGENPFAALKLAGDGALYGTTQLGGTNGGGTIFKLNPDGGGYSILRHFSVTGGEGRYPQCALVETPEGMLCGTTASGGNGEGGTVFTLNKDASGFTTVKGFYAFAGGDGFYPVDTLLGASDGEIYGTTVKGGEYNFGSLFRVNVDGSAYQVLHHFGSGLDGADPRGGLVEGTNGLLYGATYSGGTSNAGTIFSVNKNGSDYTVLLNFGANTNDAKNPFGGLIQAADGRFFGTTVLGGTNNAGTIFRINSDGGSYAILLSLGGAANSPTNPFCRLVELPTGTFFGTTAFGGTNGAGTIFKINQDGSGFSMLRSFAKDASGWQPFTGVIPASDGLLYGTTYVSTQAGKGTLYRIATNGTGFAVSAVLPDGSCRAALLETADGKLLGLACGGGSLGYGGVFTVNKDGTGYSLNRLFGTNATDGLFPKSSLTQTSDGSIFGTTGAGGIGWGTLYVQQQPPYFFIQPQSMVVLGGSSLVLSGSAGGGWPAPVYQWFFNGSTLVSATSSNLLINPVGLAQAGSYQLVISNSFGSVTSVVAAVSAYDFKWTNQQPAFTVAGPLLGGYRIDFRNDLTSGWATLTNFSLVTSPSQVSDASAYGQPQRFYRLVFAP